MSEPSDTGPATSPEAQGALDPWEVLRPLLAAGPYLPWSEGALRPSALVKIANEIVLGRRRAIVELGSGAGTIVLARLLREYGGTLTSVEHEPSWAAFVTGQLEHERLSDNARVVEAPLKPSPRALDEATWYDETALWSLPRGIDLLLVDGPPGYGEGMERSRYPALGFFRERLAPNAMVVLDDADRPGEREILEHWREDSGVEFGVMQAEGIALAAIPSA